MFLTKALYNNISGIHCISSVSSWPSVCISACTHWGETAGLDVIDFLVKEFEIEKRLKKWNIFFMLANIKAYEKYLKTWDFKWARYIDENMNRVATEENVHYGTSVEAHRMREIEPILMSVNYHIDIHSTMKSPASMAIYTAKSRPLFEHVINVDEQYIDLIKLQVWKPLVDICERSGGVGIGLETWRQEDTNAYHTAIDNIMRILVMLDMIDQEYVNPYLLPQKANKKIRIVSTVVVKNKQTFHLQKDFSHGEKLAQWTIIAVQDGLPIFAPTECVVVMPSVPETILPWEEYCFLWVVE